MEVVGNSYYNSILLQVVYLLLSFAFPIESGFLIFDSNPYLLNLQDEEIETIVNKKIHEGFTKNEIVDYKCIEI